MHISRRAAAVGAAVFTGLASLGAAGAATGAQVPLAEVTVGADTDPLAVPFEPPRAALPLRRHIEQFPFVPSDPAARDERCREAYNIQVQGLASRLASTGISKTVIGVSGGLAPAHALPLVNPTRPSARRSPPAASRYRTASARTGRSRRRARETRWPRR